MALGLKSTHPSCSLLCCRPAVVISYSVAAFAALLSALCYTEFVVELPTAGGAFNYISLVFGEFTAWCGASPQMT